MSSAFSEKEEKILKTFEKTIPKMTELEREKLLSFGEGILFVKEKEGKEDKSAQERGEKSNEIIDHCGEVAEMVTDMDQRKWR